MGFEQPGFLWAALAALTPVVIHLIGRRRARVHPFAAIQFILGSNKRIARRLRVRQWLLMAARMLLIAGLAIAFAKPYRIELENSLPATQVPTSVVLVVDSSFSMAQQRGGKTALEHAQNKATEILTGLRRESNVAVIDAGIPVQVLTPGLTFERTIAKTAVTQISQKYGRTDMAGALRQAEQLLSQSSIQSREILIFSDLQATEWQNFSHQWALGRHPIVRVIDVHGDIARGNVAIKEVTIDRAERNQGGDLDVAVTVLNAGDEQIEDVISVRIGDRNAKGIVRIPAHGTAKKNFHIQLLDTTTDYGTAEISADALPGDNVYTFVLKNNRPTQVLIVNGSPRSIPHMDETFFLRAALQPEQERPTRIQASTVKTDEFSPNQLQYTDVVILANVGEMETHQIQALTQWVKDGGGLLLTGGENTTPTAWNTDFQSIVPLPIRGHRVVEKERDIYWSSVDHTHPALEPFSSLPDASLYSAKVQQYILLDAVPRPNTSILARFTDGSPALVERKIGSGVVLMMTTSIDRDWSSLPFKTSFLPLVQQMTLYLGRRLSAPRPSHLVVHQPHPLPIIREAQSVQVVTPDGRTVDVKKAYAGENKTLFNETNQPGIYSVTQGADRAVTERFSVHVDIRESQTETIELQSVERRLNQANTQSVEKTEIETAMESNAPAGTHHNLWPGFLLGLFGLLGFEAWLALG